MSIVQIESVETPFDGPQVAVLAARLLARAEAMGLAGSRPIRSLDAAVVRGVLREMAGVGMARGALVRLESAPADVRVLESALREALEALDGSPLPAREFPYLAGVLGWDLLGRLLGLGDSSLRRYAGGARATPDVVAERLHVLALIVAELAGAYNEIGIRRWFDRPRALLDGKAPSELLAGDWSADDEGVTRVRALAASLVDSMAT